MKDKVEITKDELMILLVDKINFLTKEYQSLHESFEYEGSGKTKIDPIKFSESHQRFLAESGDINRLLIIYEKFVDKSNK